MDTFSLQARLWQEVSILSFALAILWGVLLWPLVGDGGVFLASVLAGTSGILLAMSFSLSSFAYYFDFLDAKVVYRKQLGLMGYFVALGYAIAAVLLNPSLYLSSVAQNIFTVEVGLGFLAMSILTMMALISHTRAAQWLGGKLWKDLLGLGYIAYAILVIRGILLDAPLWQEWFAMGESAWTVRMILTVLGIAVLLFRVSVPIHKKYIKKENYV